MQKNIYTLAFLFFYQFSLADTPRLPDVEQIYWSPSKEYYIQSTPEPKSKSVAYQQNQKIPLWTLDQYLGWCLLDDSGSNYVNLCRYGNLIPENYSDDLALITFYEKDKAIRKYTVSDLKKLGLQLEKTQSHWSWMRSCDLTSLGLVLVDDTLNVFVFTLWSGKLYMRGSLKETYE